MRYRLIIAAMLVAASAFSVSNRSGAQSPANAADVPAQAAFTDSNAAGLSGTKRVAITGVTIAFQASAGAVKGPHPFFRAFQSKDEVLAVLQIPDMNPGLQDALAENAYAQLKAQLTTAGYEVVPEAEVRANANYQAILKQSGFANHSRYANMLGDVSFVSPASLPPYAAYSGELGLFHGAGKTYLGWVSGFGSKSTTPGGPSVTTFGNAWKVPGLEVAMAKELNAHIVKATYVVSLGKTEARRSTSSNFQANAGFDALGRGYNLITRTTTGDANSFAQVGLVPDQTRISFRTATGNPKWQKVSMLRAEPAKDGDVVVRLAEPLLGSTDFFAMTRSGSVGGAALFSRRTTGDVNVYDTATIIDEPRYGQQVAAMFGMANKAMMALLRQ